jgi:hydrogenase expression/formation protein HypE
MKEDLTDQEEALPVGKLPQALLAKLLAGAPITDKRVLVGPGVGLDCAVVDAGDKLLLVKSDPITFTASDIGWHLVQINANDLAVCGGVPRWLMLTLLLPEGTASYKMADAIAAQVYGACRQLGISVIGGHTEITYGLDRPILVGTLIGEVSREGLVTTAGARPGDRLLLTKSVPIEATAILARDFAHELTSVLSARELADAQTYHRIPGLSVVLDARIATEAGRVTAMHDPTEGGLLAALWELATACQKTLVVELANVAVTPLSERICTHFGLNPLRAISSGSLLLTVEKGDASAVCGALTASGIACADIGWVEAGNPVVLQRQNGRRSRLDIPSRDELAKLYDSESS